MKIVNIHGVHDVRVDEASTPSVGPHDVLLKIEACGICGSDLTFAKLGFTRPGGQPWPLGHEAAGIVAEVGADVSGIRSGMRMIVNPMGDHANVIGNGGSEGAFADFLLVRNARLGVHLLEMPDGMPFERAALVEPFSVALHGVNQAAVRGGEKIIVFGAGPIGLAALFWLKRRGGANIVAVDLSDERLALARRMGADDTVNPSRVDLLDALTRIHGEAAPVLGRPAVGSDVYIDMAGGPGLLDSIVSIARFGARIVVTAVYPAPVPLDLQTMLLKEISLKMALGYPRELPEVLRELAGEATSQELEPYITQRFRFERFAEAFDAAKQPHNAKIMVHFD